MENSTRWMDRRPTPCEPVTGTLELLRQEDLEEIKRRVLAVEVEQWKRVVDLGLLRATELIMDEIEVRPLPFIDLWVRRQFVKRHPETVEKVKEEQAKRKESRR